LTFLKLSRFWINWKKSKIVWGSLVSLTVRTSVPRPHRRHPIRDHYHYLSPTIPSPRLFHSITSGGYKGSTPPWSTPPLFLLHRFTTPVPLRTLSCSPLLSHRGQPTPAPLRPSRPHPSIAPLSTSSPTARTLSVTSTLACRRPFPAADPLCCREVF
jgi:hypothetical protein